jgi:2-phospho-L-lactate guanylyltransferase
MDTTVQSTICDLQSAIHAVIPVKPLGTAKSRLAHVLNAHERRDLVLAMLADVLSTVAAAPAVARATVVSRDPTALALAAEYGAAALLDPTSSLNEALAHAASHAATHGAEALLVLPADLPLLTPADIGTLVAALAAPPAAVFAPSHDGGTNALLVAPPEELPFMFGRGSLARHLNAARRHGMRAQLVYTPGLELDVDSPHDLLALASGSGATAAQSFVRCLELKARAACA